MLKTLKVATFVACCCLSLVSAVGAAQTVCSIKASSGSFYVYQGDQYVQTQMVDGGACFVNPPTAQCKISASSGSFYVYENDSYVATFSDVGSALNLKNAMVYAGVCNP